MFKKRYDEEYVTEAPEVAEAREREAEARRLIRDEVRRIRTGEAAADIEADEREYLERELAAARAEAARNTRLHRWMGKVRTVVSGDIFGGEGISHFFDYAGAVAAMFLVSIMVIFWSLRMDMRYNRLSAEVDLLRERAVALREQRFQQCSHSSIVERLKERGIRMEDPKAPAVYIE